MQNKVCIILREYVMDPYSSPRPVDRNPRSVRTIIKN